VDTVADQSFVVSNTSGAPLNLAEWSVEIGRRASWRTLPEQVLQRGQGVTLHTKAGANTNNDIYLTTARFYFDQYISGLNTIAIDHKDGKQRVTYKIPAEEFTETRE
jgi:hypothetical protein